MTDFRQRPDTPGFEVDDEMDLLFGRANPNPNREGCLPVDVLRALSRKERSISDPGFEHLAQCSPCYREFRGYQQADARARAAARTRRQRVLAAAAVLMVVGISAWAIIGRRGAETLDTATTQTSIQTARLDLRPVSVVRGREREAEPALVRLPRGRISATVLLAVGAEPGAYEIRLLDESLTLRAAAQGTAEIRDFVTTLAVEPFDTTTLNPGLYQLGVRRVGGAWQVYPARVE